jgi:hypothetical protein
MLGVRSSVFVALVTASPLAWAEEVQPVPAPKKDEGAFTLQSADGQRSLRASFWMQTLYDLERVEDEWTTNSLAMRRARLSLKAKVGAMLSGALVADFVDPKPLLDALATFRPMEEFGITAGLFKVPVVRQFIMETSQKSFIDDALATELFRYSRDAGVMVSGGLAQSLITYELGAFNGTGRLVAQDNRDMQLTARVLLHPLNGPVPLMEGDLANSGDAKLSVGAYTSYNPVQRDLNANGLSEDRTKDWLSGFEVSFVRRGLYAAGEAFYRERDPETGDTLRGAGGYAEVGYFIVPTTFELAARGSAAWLDLDTYAVSDSPDQYEATGLAAYFVDGHRHKIQLAYSALVTRDDVLPVRHAAKLQWHIGF